MDLSGHGTPLELIVLLVTAIVGLIMRYVPAPDHREQIRALKDAVEDAMRDAGQYKELWDECRTELAIYEPADDYEDEDDDWFDHYHDNGEA